MESVLPLILYKLDGTTFGTHNIISQSPSIYFYSYQNFDVSIVSGTGSIFSVLQKTNTDGEQYLETKEQQSFIGKINFGYTLFIPNDQTTIEIQTISIDGVKDNYKFTLKLINQETEDILHYNDLIINNYLPTIGELELAILPNTNKAELLKRMLLDFKDIMRYKGTKLSIEKFFYFIGFLREQLMVMEEYKTSRKQNIYQEFTTDSVTNITTKPDKLVDSKTGNYHVLYNNWDDGEQDGTQAVNSKNLPYRPFSTEDFNALFESLKYAIPLANKYFTLVEQQITFFGICFSSNIYLFPSTVSVMHQIFHNDVFDFRKDLHIDCSYYTLTQKQQKIQTFLVKNCIQSLKVAYRSEVKYVIKADEIKHNSELYFVEREIADDEIYDDDLPQYRRTFGSLLHLVINAPNMFVKVCISNVLNETVQIIYDTNLCLDTTNIQFVTEKADTYNIQIDITDRYNNRERYLYQYTISDNVSRIDVDTFNSLLMIDSNREDNHIDLDVDSGTVTNKPISTSRNYVLPIDIIPPELSNYWDIVPSGQLRWLTQASDIHKRNDDVIIPNFILPSINTNFKLDEVSDTIPIELSEQWLELLIIPFEYNLSIRLYDAKHCQEVVVPLFNKLNEYDATFDRLFVRTMEITEVDTDIKKKYWFITTTETGISLNNKSFDILLTSNTGVTVSCYSLIGTKENIVLLQQIPVNYDFPLFPINGDEFIYASKDCYHETIEGIEYPVVKSMFPRMINIESDLFGAVSILKLGDVILSRLNQQYIVNESNVVWNVFNAFTNELMFTTTDYMLKYRIDDITCYSITCDFDIDSVHHKITKTGIFSSFKTQIS